MNLIAAPDVRATAPIRFTTIGAICDEYGGEVQTGPFGSQLHASDYSVEGTPVVMPQDMMDGRIVTEKIARVSQEHVVRLPQHRLQAGDIVYSRRGDVSRFAIVTEAESGWLCGTGSIRVRLNSPDFDIRYLRRFLQQDSVRSWLENEAKGVTMLNLNTSIIRNIPVAFPPIEEQRRIAAILDQADALRAKRRAALAQLDGLTSALFVEMFGEPLAKDSGNSRFPRVPFEDVARRITYGFTSPMTHLDTGIPILTAKNVQNGFIDFQKVHYADQTEFDALSAKSKPVRGDILITKDGTIGRCAIVETDDVICINQSVALVQIKREKILPSYAMAYLNTTPVQAALKGMGKGNALLHLQITELAKMPIPLPPLPIQQSFDEQREAIVAARHASLCALEETNALFISLQHRAFRGEL